MGRRRAGDLSPMASNRTVREAWRKTTEFFGVDSIAFAEDRRKREAGLRHEVAELRQEVKRLRAEVAELRGRSDQP
jgi:cell division protein FtsB